MATLPVAIYATRFSEAYELLHAAFAIPAAGAFGLFSLSLARRARRRDALRLSRSAGGPARAGRIFGVVGVCLALAGVVALLVYGLLEYVGSRE